MRRPPPDAVGVGVGFAGAALVLDIGGDVGALVVELAAVPASGELHAQPVGGGSTTRFHTGVHVRRAGEAAAPVAVFPAVLAGAYEVLDVGGEPVAGVEVRGGEVTRLSLR